MASSESSWSSAKVAEFFGCEVQLQHRDRGFHLFKNGLCHTGSSPSKSNLAKDSSPDGFGSWRIRVITGAVGSSSGLLKCLVLPFAEAVSAAPGHIMGCQKRTQIRRVNVECISAAHDPSCCTRIAIRNAKPSALVVYESVKRDFSFRTEIKAYRVQFRKRPKLFAACLQVEPLRYTVHGTMVSK